MSLDVYLREEPKEHKCTCSGCGNEHTTSYGEELFSSNITHNLGKMAAEAGIYQHLWRPEELNITTAKELINPLMDGLKKLMDNPDHYKQFNASNGWGLYKHFVPWVEGYLKACIEYPDAKVEVSR